MKKLFTLLAALAVALSLSMPVYAKKGGEGHRPHTAHASSKNKGKKGKKKGQVSTPGQREGQDEKK